MVRRLIAACLVCAAVATYAGSATAAESSRGTGAIDASRTGRSGSDGFALYGAGWSFTFSSYYVYYPHIIMFDDGGKETANLGFPSDKELYYQPSPFAVSDGYIFQSDTFHAAIFAWPIGGSGVAYSIPETKTVQSMAVDGSGDLYVLTGSSEVAVYQPGVAQPSRTIAAGIHGARVIAVDGLGYLYAGGQSRVSVYASGSSTPTEIIKQGVSGVVGMAIGGKERLYVANGGTNAVTAYTFGKRIPDETITAGLGTVGPIAVGPTGTLYAVAGVGAIAEYDKGGTTLSRTAVVSRCCSGNIVVDPNDTLYVIAGPVYSVLSKQTKVARRYEVDRGYQLAIGPQW